MCWGWISSQELLLIWWLLLCWSWHIFALKVPGSVLWHFYWGLPEILAKHFNMPSNFKLAAFKPSTKRGGVVFSNVICAVFKIWRSLLSTFFLVVGVQHAIACLLSWRRYLDIPLNPGHLKILLVWHILETFNDLSSTPLYIWSYKGTQCTCHLPFFRLN